MFGLRNANTQQQTPKKGWRGVAQPNRDTGITEDRPSSIVPNTLTHLAIVELQRHANVSHQAAHGQQDSVTLAGLELRLH